MSPRTPSGLYGCGVSDRWRPALRKADSGCLSAPQRLHDLPLTPKKNTKQTNNQTNKQTNKRLRTEHPDAVVGSVMSPKVGQGIGRAPKPVPGQARWAGQARRAGGPPARTLPGAGLFSGFKNQGALYRGPRVRGVTSVWSAHTPAAAQLRDNTRRLPRGGWQRGNGRQVPLKLDPATTTPPRLWREQQRRVPGCCRSLVARLVSVGTA